VTFSAHQQLIDLLEQTGTDPMTRRVIRALRQPTPRLDALDELIEELGPEIAALAVAEAYRGGLSG
jgi:hypothetical protein